MVRLSIIENPELKLGSDRLETPSPTASLSSRLTRYFDIDFYPRILYVLSIRNERQRESLLTELHDLDKRGLRVPDKLFRFIEDMPMGARQRDIIARYLEVATAEADPENYYFDPNYWPWYMHIPFAFLAHPEFMLGGDVYALSRRSRSRALVLLQGLNSSYVRPKFLGHMPLNYLRSAGFGGASLKDMLKWAGYEIASDILAHYLKSDVFKGILSVSEGELENVGLANCGKCRVLYPALAFDPKILNFRSSSKANYAMFFARLTTNKGVLELPRIFKHILDTVDVDLVVAGRFFDSRTEHAFKSALRKLKIEKKVKLTGFLRKENLYETVAKARVLLYPSHTDTFAQVIMESLAAGTPVVAYDIPGPKSVYSGLPAVKFVREFDKKAMADEAVRILRMPEGDYQNMVNDEKVMKFLRDHSSWDAAAKDLAEKIEELIENDRVRRIYDEVEYNHALLIATL
jgi:glycosyltransferase involved in cell wall biosynthesis